MNIFKVQMAKTIGTAIILTTAISTAPVFAADVAAGKAKSASCGACHGANGISTVPMYPNLAGQKAMYTAKQLKAFKSGTRADPIMGGMSKSLTDADIDNLSAYYESLK